MKGSDTFLHLVGLGCVPEVGWGPGKGDWAGLVAGREPVIPAAGRVPETGGRESAPDCNVSGTSGAACTPREKASGPIYGVLSLSKFANSAKRLQDKSYS